MKVRYSADFYKKYKKLNVRIRRNLDEKVEIFIRDPHALELDNHSLKRQWKGFRSIDITADYRAVYKELLIGDEVVAYFVTAGTHNELYRNN